MLNRFKNLRIKLKLVWGFGVAGLLLLIIGVMSFEGMNRLSSHTEFIYKTNLIPVTILSDLRGAMLRRSNLVVWHLLASDAATMAAREKAIVELDKTIEDLTAKYEPVIVTESEKKLFEQMTGGVPAYKKVRAKVLELSKNFSKDAAAELQKTELTEQLAVLYAALDGLIAENERQAQESYAASHSLSTTLNWTMIALNLMAILIGVLTVWFVSKLIVENLTKVLTAAEQLQNGNLTHRSQVATQDEIGQLATAFNLMAETMQGKVEQEQKNASEMKGITDALDRVQAVIEFTLDGTVLNANDNFLKTLGYTLAEIKGQHHRMFCEAAYANSGDYAAFWAKLNRGEFDAGQYRRIGKGGKEIWIQASYNPILDANGKVFKVVKYATDVTEHKNRNAEYKSKLIAIGKAQAVIEFSLDGTVLEANDNFLKTLGYTLVEIKGQHHRMFCEAAYANSGDYAAFWAKLNRGEFDAGQYRRIGKGGKEIWIQASYNPILDANGKVFKVVKFATDITGQKQALLEVEKLIKSASSGELSGRIDVAQFEGAAKDLTVGVNRLLDAIVTPIREAQTVLTALSNCNLTCSMTGNYGGEFDQMKSSINAAVHKLTETITVVREAVEAVSSGSEQITKGNEDLSKRTSEQAGSLEETSASMEEMTSTVKQSADNAKQANQLAIAAREIAEKGGAVTVRAVDAMGEINKSSKKIADIITVIDEIAFQTNLLALNAAVEAARAGEHGRGFAVVASEVRNLAQRSATAAKEIKGLINESIQRVMDGSELVNQSGKTLEEIVSSVKRVTDIIAEISAASQEEASGIDQVNKAVMLMDQATQQNAALVEQTTSASQTMRQQVNDLLSNVSVFKVSVTKVQKAEMSAIVTHRQETAQAIHDTYYKGDGGKASPQKPHAFRAGAQKPPAPVRTLRSPNTVAAVKDNGKDDEFEEF